MSIPETLHKTPITCVADELFAAVAPGHALFNACTQQPGHVHGDTTASRSRPRGPLRPLDWLLLPEPSV